MFAIYALLLAALAAISLKSVAVLGRGSPWTSAGWGLTVLYAAIVAAEFVYGRRIAVAGYADLVALSIAFVVAGVRDERQATPWYWPTGLLASRRERRR